MTSPDPNDSPQPIDLNVLFREHLAERIGPIGLPMSMIDSLCVMHAGLTRQPIPDADDIPLYVERLGISSALTTTFVRTDLIEVLAQLSALVAHEIRAYAERKGGL